MKSIYAMVVNSDRWKDAMRLLRYYYKDPPPPTRRLGHRQFTTQRMIYIGKLGVEEHLTYFLPAYFCEGIYETQASTALSRKRQNIIS